VLVMLLMVQPGGWMDKLPRLFNIVDLDGFGTAA